MADTILVADDDPDILRFVELNLRLEGYEVVTAADGEEAQRIALDRMPSLVILDVMMPKLDGYTVCQRLRQDGRTTGISVIMLTAKSMSADKVLGLTAGADDYISKPFDPIELVARVKTTLRRAREMRAVSPLTGLPGNVQIESELARRVTARESVAVLWLDMDNFKAFNDRYGWSRGDGVIGMLASVLRDVTQDHPRDFVGHIGGDDFVVITEPTAAEPLCREIIERFDAKIPALYDPADAEQGSITVRDRRGNEVSYPFVSISIGGATNELRDVSDHRDLVEIATEMKDYAKRHPGSASSIDRRGRGNG